MNIKVLKMMLTIYIFSYLIYFSYENPSQIRLLQTTSYITNPSRGQIVSTHCNNTNRNKLFSDFGTDGNIPNGQTVGNFFGWNISIVDYVLDQNWNKVQQVTRQSAGKIFVYAGAWLIGLAFTLILFPFFICCCICPWSCPLWNRKKQQMPYTQCQVKWPAVVTIFLLLIVLVTCIVGIISKSKAINSYQNLSCAAGVVLDDIINGNVSYYDNNNFFSGIRTINLQLKDLDTKMNSLDTQMGKVRSSSTQIQDINTKISTAKTSTAKIPDISQNTLTLTYNSPIQSSSPTSTIGSTFPTALGTKSAPVSSVGAAYISLTLYQSLVKIVSDAADQYFTKSTTFKTSITTVIDQTNRYATELEHQDKQINNYFNSSMKTVNGVSIGQYVIYGVLIFLSILCGVAVLCTSCNKNDSCRKFMYFVCVFMFLLCILTFLICIFMSIFNPITYYSCQYIHENFQSKTKLQNTLKSRFGWTSTDAEKISQCIVVNGSGDIASKLITKDVTDSLNALQTTFTNLSPIKTNYGDGIKLVYTNLKATIQNYKQAQILDVTDTNTINQLNKISKANQYTCNSNGFSSDSWVPTIKQNPEYVRCQVNDVNSANLVSCTSLTAFTSRGTGCIGCMDTFDLFRNNVTSANVLSALNTRYSDPSCVTFNTQLSNVWNNFYKKKLDIISPIKTRFDQAKIDSDNVISTIALFPQVQSNINNQFSSILNSKYGLLKGLNCKLIGQDVRMFRDTFCKSAFAYTYFLRIIFGIISLALAFLMCCITCVGHRQCKQSEFNRTNKYFDKDDEEGKRNAPSEEELAEINKNKNNYIGYNYYPHQGNKIY